VIGSATITEQYATQLDCIAWSSALKKILSLPFRESVWCSVTGVMDPLSITASIIGVIQLTSAVISAAYNYRNGVKNAPEDAVKIIDDLTGLSQILEKLLKLIEKDRSTGSAQLRTVSSLFHLQPAMLCCIFREVSR
jgi:hypothetical protein